MEHKIKKSKYFPYFISLPFFFLFLSLPLHLKKEEKVCIIFDCLQLNHSIELVIFNHTNLQGLVLYFDASSKTYTKLASQRPF